jgi:hypothetical protein
VAQRFKFRFGHTSQGDSRHLIRLAQLSQKPLGFGNQTKGNLFDLVFPMLNKYPNICHLEIPYFNTINFAG